MNSIIYFLIWGGLFFLMMRFGCGAHVMGHHHADSHPDEHNRPPDSGSLPAPSNKEIDPVCHMIVETSKAKSTVYGGQVHYFCSQDCRAKFESDPHAYAGAASGPAPAQEHRHAC
jgi:YHS domain-containing protein